MRIALAAFVVCTSIASANAATEKTLSPLPGNSPALVPSTKVLATDSPLVRAAKLTVSSRLHSAANNVSVIDDSTVGRGPSLFSDAPATHAGRVLGVGAPSGGGSAAPAPSAGGATPAAATRPAAATAPAAGAATVVSPYGPAGPSPVIRAPAMQPH
jgi:hypothetical protein